MDCQAARDHFSEHLDRRLLPDARAALDDHLGRCDACRQEWTLYTRVFTAVADLAEEPALRPFTLPREAPGVLDRRPAPITSISWRRVRAAAAVVVLLAVSHVAVFEFGQGSNEEPIRDLNVEIVEPRRGEELTPIPVSNATMLKRRLNDHVDATNLLARQIAYLPDNAQDEAKDIIEAQVRVLDSEDLYSDFENSKSQLSHVAPMGDLYLRLWKQLALGLQEDLAVAGATPLLVAKLRSRVTRSSLLGGVLRQTRMTLASEPTGLSWREPAQAARMFSNDDLDKSPVVKDYLVAHERLLRAEYLDAARAFEGFQRQHPGSRLLPLSRYMQAESYRRVGFADEALRVASQISFRAPPAIILRNDPLGTMVYVARRSLPPAVFENGAVPARHESRGIFRPTIAPVPQWMQFHVVVPTRGQFHLRVNFGRRTNNPGVRRRDLVEH